MAPAQTDRPTAGFRLACRVLVVLTAAAALVRPFVDPCRPLLFDLDARDGMVTATNWTTAPVTILCVTAAGFETSASGPSAGVALAPGASSEVGAVRLDLGSRDRPAASTLVVDYESDGRIRWAGEFPLWVR